MYTSGYNSSSSNLHGLSSSSYSKSDYDSSYSSSRAYGHSSRSPSPDTYKSASYLSSSSSKSYLDSDYSSHLSSSSSKSYLDDDYAYDRPKGSSSHHYGRSDSYRPYQSYRPDYSKDSSSLGYEPPKGTILSGHGSWDPKDGYTTVPDHTRLHFYSPHGSMLNDSQGFRVEDGRSLIRGAYHEEYEAGKDVHNYTLHPPGNLNISSSRATTVSQDTKLDYLLDKYKGDDIHWSACRVEDSGSGRSSHPYDSHSYRDSGVYDTDSKSWLKKY